MGCTAGKWLVKGEVRSVGGEGGPINLYCGTITSVDDKGRYRGEIAHVQSCENIGTVPADECQANLHAMAACREMLAAIKVALPILEDSVSSDCPHCLAEGSWTNEKTPRMIPVTHKPKCPIVLAKNAIELAEPQSI